MTKQALISPNQKCYSYDNPPVELGDYVVEVADSPFPVAEPLFWTECPDNVTAYYWYWNEGIFYPVPVKPTENVIVIGENGPTVI